MATVAMMVDRRFGDRHASLLAPATDLRLRVSAVPAHLAVLLAALIGCCYAAILFGPSAFLGETDFWHLPSGLSGGALDIRTTLSGYWWFAAEPWRWPLLSVTMPNWPDGTNAALFDIVPIVAIIGKLIHTLTGATVDPYPIWLTSCFALNAVALVALVRSLGARDVLATIVAACFGALAPVVQSRFGHLALMAHWLPVFMLALYFSRRIRPFRLHALAVGLCVLAALINPYLYVMTAAVGAAVVARDISFKRRSIPPATLSKPLEVCAQISPKQDFAAWTSRDSLVVQAAKACLGLAGIVLAGLVPLWAVGLVGHGALAGIDGDYRRYSMNLVSPFWPQSSGLLRWTGNYWLTRGSIGATPGEYEGFCYLGGGGLLLLGGALVTQWRSAAASCRRHAVLFVVLAALSAWSVSDRIYAGPYLVASYEAPDVLTHTVLAWFRSCGRLFWPVAWLLLAFGIAAAFARPRRAVALPMAILVVTLQWVDVAPWRERIEPLVRGPVAASVFGTRDAAVQVEDAIRRAGAATVIPAFACSSQTGDFSSPLNEAALEVQLMAARANARMPVVYLARTARDCSRALEPMAGSVMIFLDDPGAGDPAALPDGPCERHGAATICTQRAAGPGQ